MTSEYATIMPIRTDFYLLQQAGEQAQLLTVCRIVEKAYLQSHRIYIFCENEQQTTLLDKLLWTFRDTSFIPHEDFQKIKERDSHTLPPVLIACHTDTPSSFPPSDDILINLTPAVPDFFKHFQRIIEVIPEDATLREKARDKYRFYREQQCELHSHKLS